MKTFGYALQNAQDSLAPFDFERRDAGPQDLVLEVLFCGICHSDLLSASNSLGRSIYPMVPGHEIIGKVIHTGAAVSRYQAGDIVGIGCIIDSCRHCNPCHDHDEHYCEEGFTSSFNGRERGSQAPTMGGYSKHYVIDENYAIRIPAGMDLASAAPLLCGGVTTYAPLKRANLKPGMRVGVLGLGGLGHLAIKFIKAMGATPIMLTSSPSKTPDAQKLGAEGVILTSDQTQMQAATGTLDYILNTISAPHDLNTYLRLLTRRGTMCLVGMPDQPFSIYPGSIVFGDKSLSGSLIGGIAITQEMVDFCAEHKIGADVEIIPMDYVNTAWERMENNDVKYRFVIDMASLTAP